MSTETPPKWLNPCGFGENGASSSAHNDVSDASIVQHIVDQVKIAMNHEAEFPEKFAREIFKMDVNTLRSSFRDQNYTWLPNKDTIHKEYKENLTPEYLQSLELAQTLLDVHGNLQRIAVGVEQIVQDEKKRHGSFLSDFSRLENHLNNLICEVHNGIIDKNLPIENQIMRDIMDAETRNSDNITHINMRNWIIYREYLNMLEYVQEVFEYFQVNPPNVD